MRWNYRIVKVDRGDTNYDGIPIPIYEVQEVMNGKNDPNSDFTSAFKVESLHAESPEELIKIVEKILEDLKASKKDILEEENLRMQIQNFYEREVKPHITRKSK